MRRGIDLIRSADSCTATLLQHDYLVITAERVGSSSSKDFLARPFHFGFFRVPTAEKASRRPALIHVSDIQAQEHSHRNPKPQPGQPTARLQALPEMDSRTSPNHDTQSPEAGNSSGISLSPWAGLHMRIEGGLPRFLHSCMYCGTTVVLCLAQDSGKMYRATGKKHGIPSNCAGSSLQTTSGTHAYCRVASCS